MADRQGSPTHCTKPFFKQHKHLCTVPPHQVAAKPRFSRLPRTRFGRKSTARFSGNAAVGRGRLVLRQNWGFTLPDDRGKDAENGSILSGSTVHVEDTP